MEYISRIGPNIFSIERKDFFRSFPFNSFKTGSGIDDKIELALSLTVPLSGSEEAEDNDDADDDKSVSLPIVSKSGCVKLEGDKISFSSMIFSESSKESIVDVVNVLLTAGGEATRRLMATRKMRAIFLNGCNLPGLPKIFQQNITER